MRKQVAPDNQQARNDALLLAMKALESNWERWYRRGLTLSERMAYLLGRVDGLKYGGEK